VAAVVAGCLPGTGPYREFCRQALPKHCRGSRRSATDAHLGRPAHSLTRSVDDAASCVLVVDAAGDVLATTANAERRLASLGRASRADAALVVRSVVAAIVHQGVETAQARVRDSDGAWMMITATPLLTASGPRHVAVTIGPAPMADLTDLLLSAHGLSAREQEICHQVLAGRSTSEIAATLYISAHTVQDHLKSIFAKTGIRSRRELVAHLSHTAPQD